MDIDNLSKDHEEFVDRLIKAGLQKNVALTLLVVASSDETKSREIETITRLRQPEVSIAINELRDQNWIAKRDIKKEGKGRPVHSYYLDKTMNEIIDEIVGKEIERIEEIEDNLQQIKELSNSVL